MSAHSFLSCAYLFEGVWLGLVAGLSISWLRGTTLPAARAGFGGALGCLIAFLFFDAMSQVDSQTNRYPPVIAKKIPAWMEIYVMIGGVSGGALACFTAPKAAGDREKPLFAEEPLITEATQVSEPVLAHFWASWCGPCRAMNPTIEALARDFNVYKVNVDTNPEIAGYYGISSIPTLLIFKNGKVVAWDVGVIPEATLRAEMEKWSQS